MKLLKKMGVVAASVGVESGNQNIRKSILNRDMTNEQILESIRLLKKYDIRISTFNLIGLPTETRDNVFETIRLNRKAGVIVFTKAGSTMFPNSFDYVQTS